MNQIQSVSWLVICFFIITSANGQETTTSSTSIGNQFNYILEKSESYKDSKVVKKQWIQNLKSDVLNSVLRIEEELLSSKSAYDAQTELVDTLKNKLNVANSQLREYTNSGPIITFLGIEFKKSVFTSLLVFILLGSVISVTFFAYQFKRMSCQTNHSKSILDELEQEYQEYKRKAIEREQKISRQLQDEINKQKTVTTPKAI